MSEPNRKLDPGWTLARDAWGRLMFTDALGMRSMGVEPVRAFPLAAPGRWISLVDGDGHELALIEDPGGLPGPTRELIEEELASREFVPRIARIEGVREDGGNRDWHVETDRGAARFRIESDDQIRRLGRARLILSDVHGLRYVIEDTASLDARSRALIERYA